ncbi:MAG: ATP-binding cassette domain-containing protein [Caldilineaceae bacterium]|nr:ATP-binding cassette domain-containing protein [Caldilineaceae bacterium]
MAGVFPQRGSTGLRRKYRPQRADQPQLCGAGAGRIGWRDRVGVDAERNRGLDKAPVSAVEQPIIQVQGLTKSFPAAQGGQIAALGPVDLVIARGEFVCIVGPSGCGKTTLLRILAGLETPSDGSLTLDRDEADDQPFNSMVFQGDSTFPWLTVHDNVGYGLRVRGVPLKEREATIARMLNTVGLSRFAEAIPTSFPGDAPTGGPGACAGQ